MLLLYFNKILIGTTVNELNKSKNLCHAFYLFWGMYLILIQNLIKRMHYWKLIFKFYMFKFNISPKYHNMSLTQSNMKKFALSRFFLILLILCVHSNTLFCFTYTILSAVSMPPLSLFVVLLLFQISRTLFFFISYIQTKLKLAFCR